MTCGAACHEPPEMTDETRVLYNEDCPVCRFEIGHYRRQAEAEGAALRFDDLSQVAAWGLAADQAARRLHVVHAGRLVSGIPAFQVLWAHLSGWRWLARLIGLPGLHQVACLAYDHVLAPVLYRAHLRRQRRSGR
jgi:predicted DCC family thiol-disulfide oxidoreductase YuxK